MPNIAELDQRIKARIMSRDPHAVWRDLKKTCFERARGDGMKKEVDALEARFDQGLGPILDKWTAETGKFPHLDIEKLRKILAAMDLVIDSYIGKIEDNYIGRTTNSFKSGLKVLKEGMHENFEKIDEAWAEKAALQHELLEKARTAFKGSDPRTAWQTMKKEGLADARKVDKDKAAALEKGFDKGLGKLLDKWMAETGKFPKLDYGELDSIRTDLNTVMKDYHHKIAEAQLGLGAGKMKTLLERIDKRLTEQFVTLDELRHAWKPTTAA